ncbi:MAG: hypothetical protein R2881_07190 [Eubacteriales bacterium]
MESYLRYGFDLMLSGHTHGGQIIIPGVINGLYAPGQGFFRCMAAVDTTLKIKRSSSAADSRAGRSGCRACSIRRS